MTAGKGGEEFVKSVREVYNGPILVYCMDVSFHRTWSRKYQSVIVTDDPEETLTFCTTREAEEQKEKETGGGKKEEDKEGPDTRAQNTVSEKADKATQTHSSTLDKEHSSNDMQKVADNHSHLNTENSKPPPATQTP